MTGNYMINPFPRIIPGFVGVDNLVITSPQAAYPKVTWTKPSPSAATAGMANLGDEVGKTDETWRTKPNETMEKKL